jgi:hypothetical protein
MDLPITKSAQAAIALGPADEERIVVCVPPADGLSRHPLDTGGDEGTRCVVDVHHDPVDYDFDIWPLF